MEAAATVQITYGDLKDGDIIFVQSIPMKVSRLEAVLEVTGTPPAMISRTRIFFTGTFDEKKYAWAKGYSGKRYGAYDWVTCTIIERS
jgi:hypothetical protein